MQMIGTATESCWVTALKGGGGVGAGGSECLGCRRDGRSRRRGTAGGTAFLVAVTATRHSRWYSLPGGFARVFGARLTAPAGVLGLHGAVCYHTGRIDDRHPMMVRVSDCWISSVWCIHCAAVEVVSGLDRVVAVSGGSTVPLLKWLAVWTAWSPTTTWLGLLTVSVSSVGLSRGWYGGGSQLLNGRAGERIFILPRVTWVVDLCLRRHCRSCCMHSMRDSPPMASYARNTPAKSA